MQQCVVTVKKLNIRKSLPVNLPDRDNIIGTITEGYSFEGEEVDVAELPNQNLGKWYRDRDGKFYWGGGLTVKNEFQTASLTAVIQGVQDVINKNFNGTLLKAKIDYNQLLKINDKYKETLGAGTTIALLDTGISPKPVLKNSLLAKQSGFTKSVHKFDDVKGHGTFLTGIICGDSDKRDTIIGVAPKCRIANIKVLDDNGSALGSNLQKGLQNVLNENEPFIINLSLDISVPEYENLLNTGILELLAVKNVCIAAAGENEQLLAGKEIFFPAASDHIIAVGSIDHDFIKNNPNPHFNPKLDYIIPQFNLVSFGLNTDYVLEPGVSSMACAIVSAIAALIFSSVGIEHLSVERARKELDLLATPFNELGNLDSLELIKP